MLMNHLIGGWFISDDDLENMWVDTIFSVCVAVAGSLIIFLIIIIKIRHNRMRKPLKCAMCSHIHYGICYEVNTFVCDTCGHQHIGMDQCNNLIWRKKLDHNDTFNLNDKVSVTIQANEVYCRCQRQVYYCPCILRRTGLFLSNIEIKNFEHNQIVPKELLPWRD